MSGSDFFVEFRSVIRVRCVYTQTVPVGTQTRTRSDRKSIIKRPHTRNGRQYNVCHY